MQAYPVAFVLLAWQRMAMEPLNVKKSCFACKAYWRMWIWGLWISKQWYHDNKRHLQSFESELRPRKLCTETLFIPWTSVDWDAMRSSKVSWTYFCGTFECLVSLKQRYGALGQQYREKNMAQYILPIASSRQPFFVRTYSPLSPPTTKVEQSSLSLKMVRTSIFRTTRLACTSICNLGKQTSEFETHRIIQVLY